MKTLNLFLVSLLILSVQFAYSAPVANQTSGFSCHSTNAGRPVAVLGSKFYTDNSNGQQINTPVINTWIEKLQNNYLFSEVKYDSKKDKYLARRKLFGQWATVTIEKSKKLVVVKYAGTTNSYTDSDCTPTTGE